MRVLRRALQLRNSTPRLPYTACNQRDRIGILLPTSRCSLCMPLGDYRITPNLQLRYVNSSARGNADPFSHADATIFALATAPGRAAIAIIRISGRACNEICGLLSPDKPLPKPRVASFRTLRDPADPSRNVLDPGVLVLRFPAPNSSTGEDVLELHVHGGPAIVKSVLTAIESCNSNVTSSIRYADPGEFTRRAFLNDRISLPEVEALGDTLSAVTEEQRRLSVRGTTSSLAKRYENWREMLLYARGELEALIDFSEDQHFDESPNSLATSVARQVEGLVRTMNIHIANAVRGELLRDGIGISLVGSPNVGKSSILNQIVGRNAAIVSREAGTTRDVVEVGIDLGGFFCRLGDTAGLRHSKANSTVDAKEIATSIVGEIEQEGIRRAKEKALDSDVVIVVLSIEPSLDNQGVQLQLEQEVIDTTNELLRMHKSIVFVVNKMDRYGVAYRQDMENELKRSLACVFQGLSEDSVFCVSCLEVENALQQPSIIPVTDPGNFQNFLHGLSQEFKQLTSALSGDKVATAEVDAAPGAAYGTANEADISIWQESLSATSRQRDLLERCVSHLRTFLKQVNIDGNGPNPPAGPETGIPAERGLADTRHLLHELEFDQTSPPADPAPPGAAIDVDIVVAAESLRAAADCLARITGRAVEAGDVDEVLGVVFEK